MFADLRLWDDLLDLFTDQVDVDYSSLTGARPATLRARDLVDGWAESLSVYDSTHHVVGSHVVDVGPDGGARCIANATATHTRQAPPIEGAVRDFEWTMGGRYIFELITDDASATLMRVRSIAFIRLWESGDRRIGERNFNG